MKKVYLDHKDFKNMARGLRGEAQYIGEAKNYQILLNHVRTGDLACYFSALHVLEAVRYKGDDPQELESYCTVLESLTQGKSIVWAESLEERELKFFVQNRFRIPLGLSADTYPYGEYLEAFPGTLETCAGWASQFKKMWDQKQREVLRPLGKTRNERRLIQKELPSLAEFTLTPEMMDTIPDALRHIYTPEIMTALIRGMPHSDNNALLSLIRRAMGIRELLAVWKATCPDLEKMGRAFDASGQQLIDMISYNRSAVGVFGSDMHKQAVKDGLTGVTRMLAKRFARRVHQLFPGQGITKKQLEEALISTGLSAIPSWHVVGTLYYQYTLDSVGSAKRNILASDIRDIIHMRCLPYVDFIVTDRYFAELTRRVSGYKTIVFRNVQELVTALDQSV